MWGKNSNQNQNQGRNQSSNDYRNRTQGRSEQKYADQKYVDQNYASDQNPYLSDLDSNRYQAGSQSADHFNGAGQDDYRSEYSTNSASNFGRDRDNGALNPEQSNRFGNEGRNPNNDPSRGNHWNSDYSNRSGSSVSNRQGQTGGSPFSTQYGLNYGSGSKYSSNQGSSYGNEYGAGYGDRKQNWGERSDYGAEHFDLDSANDKDRWSQSALGQKGPHHGKGPKGYRRSDERIHEEANERLTHDHHLDASEIEVTVQDGVITLSGTVEERRYKRLAEDCVEGISGATDIKNELRVQSKSDNANRDASSGKKDASNSNSKAAPSGTKSLN